MTTKTKPLFFISKGWFFMKIQSKTRNCIMNFNVIQGANSIKKLGIEQKKYKYFTNKMQAIQHFYFELAIKICFYFKNI